MGLLKIKDRYVNTIFINIGLRYLIPIQVERITEHHRVTCGCERCISTNSLHVLLLLWIKMINKFRFIMEQSSNIHSCHKSHKEYMIYTKNNWKEYKWKKDRYIERANVCTNTEPDIDLPHWKYVCGCCQNSYHSIFLTNGQPHLHLCHK